MAAIIALFVTLIAVPAGASVKPGNVITAQSADKVKDMVSPGVFYMVKRDMRMNIVPSDRIDWPPPYKEATRILAQVRLGSDHRSLVGYAAGQPFPLIDVNDPYVATELAWNNMFARSQSDDYDLRFFDCQSEYISPGHPQPIIENIEVGHYAGYNLVGRTEVEPIPIDPDYKSSGLWLFALYPIIAPRRSRIGIHSFPGTPIRIGATIAGG